MDAHSACALARDADRDFPAPGPRAWAGPLRHAVEVRQGSYRDPAFTELLRDHGVALVVADSAGAHPLFDTVTADFVYVRLHGPDRLYHGSYGTGAIDAWARRLRGWSGAGLDCYVYFDNDADAAAPHDAMALIDAVGTA